jgi:HEAT repeat protein
LARLRSGPSDETNHLIHIISLIGTEENVSEIGRYLKSPISETVCDALKAVGMLNGREFFPDMVGLLGSPHENIQNAALGGISLLKPREWLYDNAMELAGSENIFVRRGGYRILGFTSLMGAVNLLITGLSDESAICRAAAMQSLGYIGARDKKLMENKSFLGAVGRVLVDEEKFVRLEAVLAFARINGEKTFEYLLDMLDGEDREVQNYVIRAVGRCRVAEASEKLCQMLENQDNTEQAILLCQALGRSGKREAVGSLAPFVDSIIPELASEAVAALSMIGGEKVIEEILPHLHSRSWLVCAAAINAMAELKAVSAAPIIAKLSLEKINDDDWPILAHTALKALAKIGGVSEMKTVLTFLDRPECQYEAFAAVCGILTRVRERVFDIGSITNPTARRLACLAAGFSFVDGFKEDILARLNDDYPSVRRAAALALAGAHLERSGAIPSTCLSDGDAWVVKISKNAMGDIK